MMFESAKVDDATLVLRIAHDRIVKGWCQDAVEDYYGNVCPVGAISRQNASDRATKAALNFLSQAMGFDNPEGIVPWQKAPGRTHDEIIASFDLAILLSMNHAV